MEFNMDFSTIFQDITIPIWIPSQQTTVSIKPIRVDQLSSIKELAVTQTDPLNPIFDSYFLNLLKDQGLDVSNITYWDYESIGHQLLADIYQTPFIPVSGIPKPLGLFKENIGIYCQIPSISRHLEADHWLYTTSQNLSGESIIELLGQRITKSLLVEFSKYIYSMKVSEESIALDSISLEQRLELIQRLPASIFQQIYNQVTEWQKILRDTFPEKFGPWLFV